MLRLLLHSIIALAACSVQAQTATFDYSQEYAPDPVHSDSLPRASDLATDAVIARERGIPVMIEFSTEWCEYCKVLEQQILEPMLKSGEYDNRVILRKLLVDDNEQLKDFDGSTISATAFGHRAGVELYPTILFFDADGNEVAQRIVGITVMDFLPKKIDKALERAKRNISSTPSGEN